MEGILDLTQATQKEIHDHLYRYEEVGLKMYSEDEKQMDRYTLFKHPQKVEVKAKLDGLPTALMNPYKTMRLWLRWEQLDIQALLEAVEIRGQIEKNRNALQEKRVSHQKELEKLNLGGKSFKTLFSSNEGKVNRITELTHKISKGEKEIECLDLYLKILVLQLNQAAIPYFKRDKVAIYNDLLNVYSQNHIQNSQAISECYQMIMKANQVFEEDKAGATMTKSIHQLE